MKRIALTLLSVLVVQALIIGCVKSDSNNAAEHYNVYTLAQFLEKFPKYTVSHNFNLIKPPLTPERKEKIVTDLFVLDTHHFTIDFGWDVKSIVMSHYGVKYPFGDTGFKIEAVRGDEPLFIHVPERDSRAVKMINEQYFNCYSVNQLAELHPDWSFFVDGKELITPLNEADLSNIRQSTDGYTTILGLSTDGNDRTLEAFAEMPYYDTYYRLGGLDIWVKTTLNNPQWIMFYVLKDKADVYSAVSSLSGPHSADEAPAADNDRSPTYGFLKILFWPVTVISQFILLAALVIAAGIVFLPSRLPLKDFSRFKKLYFYRLQALCAITLESMLNMYYRYSNFIKEEEDRKE